MLLSVVFHTEFQTDQKFHTEWDRMDWTKQTELNRAQLAEPAHTYRMTEYCVHNELWLQRTPDKK